MIFVAEANRENHTPNPNSTPTPSTKANRENHTPNPNSTPTSSTNANRENQNCYQTNPT